VKSMEDMSNFDSYPSDEDNLAVSACLPVDNNVCFVL